MGIINKEEVLYLATQVDMTGLKAGKREVLEMLRTLFQESSSMDIFSGVSMSAAAAFTQVAGGIGQLSQEFDAVMQEIAGQWPEMGDDSDHYRERILQMLAEIPVSIQSCTEAFSEIIAAGYRGAEAMNVLERSARNAAVSGKEVAEAFAGLKDAGCNEEMDFVSQGAGWEQVTGSVEAQMQLLQNRLMGMLRPFGEGILHQVAEVATSLGQALSDGKIVSNLKSLDTLMTVAAIAMQEYKTALSESEDSFTAEGTALEMVTGLRAAYQSLLSAGLTLHEEETARQHDYLAAIEEVRETEEENSEARKAVWQQSLEMAAGMTQIVAEEVIRNRERKEVCEEDLQLRQQALKMAQDELQQADETVKALQEEYDIVNSGTDAVAEQMTVAKLHSAQEAQSAAVIRVGNAEREMRNAQLRLETVNQRGATASMVANTVATGSAVAADGAAIASTTLLAKAKQYATVATRSLTAAMAANPIGMVLNVVSLAVTAFSAFGKESEHAATAQERLNEALEKQKERTSSLVSTLYNQNEADASRVEALLELRKLYPEVWEKIDLANLAEQNRNELLKKGNELLAEKKERELEAALAASSKRQKDLGKTIELVGQGEGATANFYYIGQLRKEEERYRSISDELEHIRKVKEAVAGLSLSKEDKIEKYKADLVGLKERLQDVNNQLTLVSGSLTQQTSYNPAEHKETAMLLSTKESLQGQVAEKEANLSDLQKPKEATKADLHKRERAEKQLTDMVVRMELERQKSQIEAMSEGREKRLEIIKLEYQEREKEIARKEQDLMAVYQETGEPVPQRGLDMLAKLRAGNLAELEQKKQKIDQAGEAEVKAHIEAQTNLFLSAEQQKLKAIEDRYDKEKKWVQSQKDNIYFNENARQEYAGILEENEATEKKAALLAGIRDAGRELDEALAEWQVKLNAAGDDSELKLKLQLAMDEDISRLEVNKLVDSDEWLTLFNDLDNLTVSQIDKLIADIETQMSDAKLLPVDKKAVLDNLNDARQKVIEMNPFRSLGDSLQNVFKKGADSSGESKDVIQREWSNLGKSTQGCFDFVNDAVGSCEVLGDLLGESGRESIAMVQGITSAGIAMATAIQTAETSSVILTAIAVALQVVNALFSIFNKDRKKEKRIQSLQAEVEGLERAYDKLGKAIDNTYSDRAFDMMDEQNENLRQQQELIRQQIAAEKSKKKTDNGKIRDWQNQLDDINQQLEENHRKRIEMLAGTDVRSAIDEFADALVEAYARGEDGAVAMAETTKKVMANAVKEALKRKFLGDQIEAAVNYLGQSMDDGKLTDVEKTNFQRMVNAAGERFSETLKVYDDLFSGNKGIEENGVSGQLQEAMTEGTANQLVGLWNMTANDIRVMRNLTAEQISLCAAMNLNVGEVLRQQYLIEMNTRRTADNTAGTVEELKSGFLKIDGRLKTIDENTKGYTGRGK